MKYLLLIVLAAVATAAENSVTTLITQPMQIRTQTLLVPAAKFGPEINQSCQLRSNQTFSCSMPAEVAHEKNEQCPNSIARLLAIKLNRRQKNSIPLTISNAWQWQFLFPIDQSQTFAYELASHGGAWEISLESLMTLTNAEITAKWQNIDNRPDNSDPTYTSSVETKHFSSLRPRYGYPHAEQF